MKILLVGKIDVTLISIHENLEAGAQVQICSPIYENVEGMMKIISPDMVVLVGENDQETDREIAELLRDTWADVPVLVICTAEIFAERRSLWVKPQFMPIFEPFEREELPRICVNTWEAYRNRGTSLGSAEDIASQFAAELELRKGSMETRTQILVVDDSPLILRNIKSMLEDSFDILLASSGEKALELVDRYQIDLILLDYEMPEMNGLEVFKELKKSEKNSMIPVLFLTGVADKERFMEVLNYHPAGYILKPLDEDKIMPAILQALMAPME